MRNPLLLLLPLLFILSTANASAQKITRETFVVRGKTRTYYLYIPAKEINQSAWGFLSRHELAEEPQLDRGRTAGQFGAAPDETPPPSEQPSEPPAREKTAAAYVNRGSAYRALKRYDEAVADFTKAATLAPSPEAFFNRGVTHEQKGDPDAALADYTQALALDPKLAPAYVNRGIILLQKATSRRPTKTSRPVSNSTPHCAGGSGTTSSSCARRAGTNVLDLVLYRAARPTA